MNTQIVTPKLDQVVGDIYVKVQLDKYTSAILSMDYVQEVLIVPISRISPMPNMPHCILRSLNRRNRVLWVIDLAQVLNLSLDTNAQQYHIVIILVNQVSLALVVQEVKGVIRFTPDCIQSSIEQAYSDITDYIHGWVVQAQETLMVLNSEAIVHSPSLHNY